MKNLIKFAVNIAFIVLIVMSAGCGRALSLAPKQVCVCEAIWNDPTCQAQSQSNPTGTDTGVFVVPCPNGLESRGDAGLSFIKSKDVDFNEMADSTVKQIVAWSGMNLTKVTGTTNGSYRGDVDHMTGRSQFAQVLGCAVVKLGANDKPQDVKGWWKFTKPVKKHAQPPVAVPDMVLGTAGPADPCGPNKPPPDPPSGGGAGGGSDAPNPCDVIGIDEDNTTVTIPSECGAPIAINDPSDLASCTSPTCPVDSSDSTCLTCAKINCCADMTACLADDACASTAQCLLTSGGLASCASSADSTAYATQACLTVNCAVCAAPTDNCGGVGALCGANNQPCCANKGLGCFTSDIGILSCM